MNFSSITNKFRGGASKQLGISATQLAKTVLEKQEGYLKRVEFALFWEAMEGDPNDLSIYLHTLLQHLLQYLSNDRKLVIPCQVLLNSINFITLRVALPDTKQVQEVLGKWNKAKQKYESRVAPAAKEVLGVLHKRLVERTEALDSMINYTHYFYSHDEMNKVADYYENPTIVHILGGRQNIGANEGDRTFMWEYLKNLSKNPEEFKEMLNLSVVKLRAVVGTVYMLPKLAEISLLALIFMFTQWIGYNRIPDDGLIEKTTVALKKFYVWPVPYGTSARDLLVKLKKERIAPGLAMMHRLWREACLPEVTTEDIQTFRPIYYFLDSRDSEALVMANQMFIESTASWGENYTIQKCFSPRMCAILLFKVLHHDIGISQLLIKSVRKLNENEIMSYYSQAIEIFLESTTNNDPKAAKEARGKALGELIRKLISQAKDKSDDDHIDLQELPTDYWPQLSPLKHTGIICDLIQEEWPKKGQIASGDAVYPVNEVLIKMRNILLELVHSSSEKNPITLRFAIAGSDRILNAVCCAYAALYRHYSGLIAQFKLEFFILPFSENHYADWLARMDPWYNRHIYIPFQSPLFVCPEIHPTTRPKKDPNGKITCVGRFYRDMCASYFQESEHMANLMVWEVHCWNDETFTNTPDQIIPFCQRVVLGRQAEFEGYKTLYTDQDNDEHESDGEEETEERKDAPDAFSDEYVTKTPETAIQAEDNEEFEYKPVPLNLVWDSVDMMGSCADRLSQKGQRFEELRIASCPMFGNKGFPPNPSEEGGAQMHAILATSGKKSKQEEEYRLLMTEPSQHVRTVTVSADKVENRFWILVDGRLYGPFTRIRVMPMVDIFTKRQVYMPIKTFFPISI